MLDGGADAFVWLLLGVLRPFVLPQIPELSGRGYGTFLAFYVAGIFAFLFLLWTPLRTLTETVSIVRLWRNLLRDTRLLTYAILVVSWGYVCTLVWVRAGIALGLVCFAPLPFIAAAMQAIHAQRLELHRLRLARDAVQAMLRTNDPLPQMNSLLASLHTPAAEETLQIYAAIEKEDRLTPLATIGPIPDADRLDCVRRALAELQHADRPSVSQRSNRAGVTAYAVRTPNDALLGALVVHRTARTSSLMPARRFAQAASELAPLLRDFQAIAATQTAARVDALTGLPNRRTIMELLRERIEHVSIGNPCAVLVLDIDHFKAINDALGHQAGDQCLRTVGAIIARNIRHMDRAGRIGGEEFVILMPDTTSEMARSVGERLRAAIETADVRHANGEPVTASIGVAVASISDTVDSLLARADRALYQAKRQGRNRVIELGA
jgi:diguanylate cyclase (GGDEF)-like protein